MSLDEARAHLEFRFPDLRITQAGGACPFQAEGTLHGLEFYFRFRHSYAELRIQSGQGWFKPLYTAGGEYTELCATDPEDGTDHEDLGWLHGREFVHMMSVLIARLRRAPILWEFPGVETVDIGRIKAGEPHAYGTWGHTPEEAWAAMHEPSAYLRAAGIDDATQAQWVSARRMSPDTVTVDDRIFPNPDPFAEEQP